ncbi:hypothetical protein NLJ89_g3876 [Agrocybe chaxingu]|uniref:Cytochrome P450 n=1 Tax=Agrocybe chaxingu TaxID=84603 RepID=A0A9W8MWG6_9AGAR|nr:hypothetical protein NLJ89_g3876 [Agrocybe chaxingu]
MGHVPFSDATVLTLTQANIKVEVLEWNSDGRSQAQHLGGKTTPNALSLDATTKQIGYIRKHIAFETEAGCRILISAVMLHAITNLDTSATSVAIAPEFRIPYAALDSGGSSYAGPVDYLMALGTPSVRDAIVLSPQLAFTDAKIHRLLTCSIYEAKPEKVLPTLPQVVMEAVIQSQRFEYFELSSLRSVLILELGLQPSEVASQLVKNGSFLFYNKNQDGPGGSASYLPPIRLEHDLSGLPLILGLLYDWIENGQQKTLKFSTITVLAIDRDEQEKAYREITSVITGGLEPTPEDLSKLPHTLACFNEALRMYREYFAEKFAYEQPPTFPPLFCSCIPNDHAHYAPGYRNPNFFPELSKFKPSRWYDVLEHDITMFGSGPRSCIGRKFGHAEALTSASATH